jgi:hypothetical protein
MPFVLERKLASPPNAALMVDPGNVARSNQLHGSAARRKGTPTAKLDRAAGRQSDLPGFA